MLTDYLINDDKESFMSLVNAENINEQDGYGNNLLAHAIRLQKIDWVFLLLEQKISIEFHSKDENILFYVINYIPEENLILKLIESNKHLINILNKKKQNLLHVAISNLKYKVIDYLLQENCDINNIDYEGYTPLILAIKTKKYNLCKKLIKLPNLEINCINNNKNNILLLLIENIRDEEFIKTIIVDMIEKKKIEPEKHRNQLVNKLHVDFIPSTKDYQSKIINTYNHNFDTPLHMAIKCNNTLEFIKFLCQNNADINWINKKGFNPLMLSIEHDRSGITSYLIKKNADINYINLNKESALSCAINGNSLYNIRLLIDNNIRINKKKYNIEELLSLAKNINYQIYNILFMYIYHEEREIIQQLLELENCYICQKKIETYDAYLTSCIHVFHYNCLYSIKKKGECPICSCN